MCKLERAGAPLFGVPWVAPVVTIEFVISCRATFIVNNRPNRNLTAEWLKQELRRGRGTALSSHIVEFHSSLIEFHSSPQSVEKLYTIENFDKKIKGSYLSCKGP